MARRTKVQILAAKAEEAKLLKAAEFKTTDMTRRAANADGRTKTQTDNHQYPTFPHSGPKTTLGQIGRAFEDIDNRIDGVQAGGVDAGSITADKLKTDTPEALQAFQDALEVATVDDLDTEAAERAAGDKTNADAIAAEAKARKSADDALDKRVDSEKQYRADGDAKLQEAIDAETDEREAADTELSTKLDTEIADRKAADEALQEAVTSATDTATKAVEAEAAARQEADTQLETKITAETEARTAADTALEQKVTDEVAKEAAARNEAIATAVEPKADKTYVDEQLATKLDAADVPTADTLDGVTPIGRAVMKAQEKDNARFAIDAAATEHTHEIADVIDLQTALDNKQNTADAFSGNYVDLKNIPTEFTPRAHTHQIADVDGLQDALDAKLEEVPVASGTESGTIKVGSTLQIQDGVLDIPADTLEVNWDEVKNKPDQFPPTAHTHAIAEVDALQHELDLKLNADANAVSATKLETARNININGDATGTASFDGTADANITITLTNAGTTGRQLLKAETAGDANNVLGLLSVLDYKGTVDTETALPEDAALGDVYNVTDTGMNYAWNGTSWDALGAVTTLTTLGVTATADELNYTDGVTAPIQTQLDAKQTKDDANAFETLVGETYATKTELAAKADATAIADMLTKTEAAAAYQPKGDYATKGELAAKQDAATAFDGKYTSLTEVPSQFTPAAHTHVIADVTGLQDALDAKADTSAIPTIPGNATTSEAGLMSSEDKTKLDSLNNYVLPEATADVLGGVKIGAGLQIQDGKLTTSNESKTFANPEVIGASETLDLATATNGVYSINGGSITGLTGSNETAAALVINAGATHPSALAFDGAFATEKVLPVCQDGTTWFKLTAMDRAEFVADPAGDTVTKEEFIALRDALVTAGIMKPKA